MTRMILILVTLVALAGFLAVGAEEFPITDPTIYGFSGGVSGCPPVTDPSQITGPCTGG